MYQIIVKADVSTIPEAHRAMYLNRIKTQVGYTFEGHRIQVSASNDGTLIEVQQMKGGFVPNEAEIAYRQMHVRMIISDATDMAAEDAKADGE